ncbi:TonB-dependent receptor domain-containing protein [Pseudoxanthomonas mexicana]|uniref:TonB-dependent receptor domain-containing protein n=1 Tax=Pseudoxanthomonas mexicana TaxID=128785 RepID=UPI00398BB085
MALALAAGGAVTGARAQDAVQRKQFEVPAQSAASALNQFAEQADITLVFSQDVVSKVELRSLSGTFTTQEGLAAMLEGTGLSWQNIDARTISIIREAPSPSGKNDTGTRSLDAVIVTGTRIRGATTPSPLISISQAQIREDGHADLGEVIRAIPQNFSGGQNPGVALGASLSGVANQNLTSGSALNLRGLGADATLTLLNGRRLSYSGFTNAIDISVIPIGALERVEVVADGASAIYGSDAVAGVANIVTRRDFDGVRADARVGAASDGGGIERRYGLTAGTTWNGGGAIAAYEYTDMDPILASQRAYLGYMPRPELTSILPGRRQSNLFASAYKDLGDAATISLDAVRTRRDTSTEAVQTPMHLVYEAESENTAVAPTLEFFLPREWSLTLGGSYARDRTVSMNRYFTLDGVWLRDSGGCYCNTTRALEIGAEGPVFALAGGDVRTAVGAGWRENDFENRSYTSTSLTAGRRSSRYAYGEVNMPLVSPEQELATHRLDFTAAFRHEDYGDMGSVTTPKLGVVYQPRAGFTLKSSWGRSYKAPNLMQQHQSMLTYLRPAAIQGAVGYPPDATALTISGGNPDLKPERAESWTASILFHPQSVPGLQLELGVFDIDYTDRVVMPVSNIQATFRDPAYAEFIVFNPPQALQAELIARSGQPLLNATGAPYDPSKVMGLVYATYANVARQRIRGVDLSGTYGFDLGGGRMTLRGSGSWLDSRQRNTSAAEEFDVAGKVFNPAKFRGRVGATWNRGPFMLSSFLNHVGGVTDNLRPVETRIASFTTVDANARYTFAGEGALAGVGLGLSVQNLLDREPPLMAPLFDFIVNYDSTNHSAIGRFVSLSVSKQW